MTLQQEEEVMRTGFAKVMGRMVGDDWGIYFWVLGLGSSGSRLGFWAWERWKCKPSVVRFGKIRIVIDRRHTMVQKAKLLNHPIQFRKYSNQWLPTGLHPLGTETEVM